MLPHNFFSTIGIPQVPDIHFLLRQIVQTIVGLPPEQIIERSTNVSQKIISFHYTLTGPDGKTLDSSAGGEPLTFLEGVGQIIPGLETAVSGKKAGEKKPVNVKDTDA